MPSLVLHAAFPARTQSHRQHRRQPLEHVNALPSTRAGRGSWLQGNVCRAGRAATRKSNVRRRTEKNKDSYKYQDAGTGTDTCETDTRCRAARLIYSLDVGGRRVRKGTHT